jgi:Holliday junction resolvasome RuvABC ATP-dependent DNA helicase subunit
VNYLAIIVHRLQLTLSIISLSIGEAQMKIPVPQKPNSSSLFTGRKHVLDRLGKIFVGRTDNRPRRSCLLWGMGGIGKTQICLKFTEEMSDR